jgi:hypothetical protein
MSRGLFVISSDGARCRLGLCNINCGIYAGFQSVNTLPSASGRCVGDTRWTAVVAFAFCAQRKLRTQRLEALRTILAEPIYGPWA